jgi:hypothetical protein
MRVRLRSAVGFAAAGGRTRLTLVQRGFATAARRDNFNSGWAGILDALERVVVAR